MGGLTLPYDISMVPFFKKVSVRIVRNGFSTFVDPCSEPNLGC